MSRLRNVFANTDVLNCPIILQTCHLFINEYMCQKNLFISNPSVGAQGLTPLHNIATPLIANCTVGVDSCPPLHNIATAFIANCTVSQRSHNERLVLS